jgi:pyruvate dehydrogenase E2 component (dihydrolipoyllysine-residue acetyltransferase)
MAVTKVVMPKLSEAMESGKIIKWLKKEGDRIQGGDILAEVETDKADVEMEAFGAGVLRKVLVNAGDRAPVGNLIAVIAEPNEDISSVVATAPAPAAPPAVAAPQPAPAVALSERPASVPPQPGGEDFVTRPPAPAPPASGAEGERLKISPLARKIAAQAGVDLRLVHGSGPGGRIVRRDVESARTAAPAAAPPAQVVALPSAPAAAAGPEYEDVPLTSIRAAIARRMPLAKAPVPHFYVSTEVAMDRAWDLREELNALPGRPKISVNDFVVRACALGLTEHPGVNASFQGDAIRVYRRVHLGIAVALDEGLITPVLRDVHLKSLTQIALEARDLGERARARRLRANEMSGATFSISNLGMFDVTEFSAIINPPEGAILAVGAVRRVPVAGESGVTVGRRMVLTLSCDHRVMDGAMGARFLGTLKRLLEEPLRLLA